MHRCVLWSLICVLIGVGYVAYAQDGSTAPADLSGIDLTHVTLGDLIRGGGLPAVLGGLGWLWGRNGGVPIAGTVRVEVSPETVKQMADAIADSINRHESFEARLAKLEQGRQP